MSLFKYTNLVIIALCVVLLQGCASNIFSNKSVYNNIFVNDISERRGMIIRNTLLEYFPNRNYNQTQYVINVSTKKSNENYLTVTTGFASRNRINITANWSVTYKPNNKVLLEISNQYSESFNIEKVGQSNVLNEQITEEYISRSIARDIALKTFSLMLQIQKNPSLLQEEEKSKK